MLSFAPLSSLADQVDALVGGFWQSPFGSDWSENFYAAGKYPQFCSLEAWERSSKENPLFMLQMDWREAEITLQQFLGRAILLGGGEENIYNATQVNPDMVCKAMAAAWKTVEEVLNNPRAGDLDDWLAQKLNEPQE